MLEKNLKIIILYFVLLIFSVLLIGCGSIISSDLNSGERTEIDEPDKEEARQDEQTAAEILSITPEEVYKIIKNNEDYLIIDVRSAEEYAEGHIESAKLIPVSELGDRLDELPDDKPIIVYCRSGGRSRSAASILIENGFGNVYDMGGIKDWQAEDYPVVIDN